MRCQRSSFIQTMCEFISYCFFIFEITSGPDEFYAPTPLCIVPLVHFVGFFWFPTSPRENKYWSECMAFTLGLEKGRMSPWYDYWGGAGSPLVKFVCLLSNFDDTF